MSNVVDDYFGAEEVLFDHFGYEQGWHIYTPDDCRRYYWCYDSGLERIFFTEEPSVMKGDYDHLGDYIEIVTNVNDDVQPPVRRIGNYTMVLMDTQSDSGFMAGIFDNWKEVPYTEDLLQFLREN